MIRFVGKAGTYCAGEQQVEVSALVWGVIVDSLAKAIAGEPL